VNVWLIAAIALIAGLLPCGYVCLRAYPADRLVAYELAGIVDVLILLLLAQAFDRDVFFDLSLGLAVLSLAGGLVFAHFMERWV
jgi:multicomponent Na+:H+ antiporter subunit F